MKDDWIDPFVANALDVSLGIGQVRISTATKIEDAGYMSKTVYYEWHGNSRVNNRRAGIINKLQSDKENVRYAAAYLSYFQDLWKDSYPEIDGRTAILATLYNLGEEQTSPNANPQPNNFGTFARDNYYYMRRLLGLD